MKITKRPSKASRQSKRPRTAGPVTRTEKRSWIVLTITAFGALIVRYLRIVQDHGRRLYL